MLVAWMGCGEAPPEPSRRETTRADTQALRYLGAERCATCHAEEARRWRGSHHDLAMQVASPETVLGDFSDARFEREGERLVFRRRDGRFFVEAPDALERPREFEVAYTFGVEPLQQYLVGLEGGRLQALGVAWDTRPSPSGQRWFHLHPDESVPPGDVLHWTGPAGSWNALCADCHSTNVSKGYQAARNRYETTWSETDVSCEACHGPGSAHVSWAEGGVGPNGDRKGLVVDLRNERAWQLPAEGAIARRVPPVGSANELDTCAPCHARRARIARGEPGGPFLDAYRPALLEEGLYHADGQILDEVYVWGSFVQSRMHGAGVLCSDCHDPHALRIEQPDAVCAGCHRSAVFATASHHHHAEDSSGASCVACHMPARTYMVVDPRRDHGFRVPRPDLSVAIGVPNACSGCHDDRPAAWAAEAAAAWYGSGRSERTHYAEVLAAGRHGAPGAARALAALVRDRALPAIVRATALGLLSRQLDAGSVAGLRQGLRDPSALVRMAAATAGTALPPEQRWAALEPLLRDPRRAVRVEAGRVLAPWQARLADPAALRTLDAALAEYRDAQELDADLPQSHVNLGILHADLGDPSAAERAYRTAIRRGPYFVPAYVNLAELHRSQGRDDLGERVLREGLQELPESGDLHHALGLLLVRQQRRDAALEALGRAARLAPERPRFAYGYGIALDADGERQHALEVLAAAHRVHPWEPDLLVALTTLHRDAGQHERALHYARLLLELRPEDPATRALVDELGRATPGGANRLTPATPPGRSAAGRSAAP